MLDPTQISDSSTPTPIDSQPQAPSMQDILAGSNAQPPASVTTVTPGEMAAQPGKPSLWRAVLSGALAGLANSGGSKSFGQGLATGAAGEINDQQRQLQNEAARQEMQQRSQLAMDRHTQQQVETATAQVNLAEAMRNYSLMPKDKQELFNQVHAADTEKLEQSGAWVTASPAFADESSPDFINAGANLHSAHPENVYTPGIFATPEGGYKWQWFQVTGAPLQAPLSIQMANGKYVSFPKGTSPATLNKAVLEDRAQWIKDQSASGQAAINQKNAAANASNAKAAAAANGTVQAQLFEGTDANGNQIAGTPDELKAANVQHFVKMPALVQTQTLAARELTSPDGLFATARKQILDLNSKGELGPVSSRWNNFWAGKGLNGDQQAFRGTLQLIATKLMQAHMGNRGGKDALEHFAGLVPENSTPAALMATLNNEYGYVNGLAKRAKAQGGK